MNRAEYLQLLKEPERVEAFHAADLKALVDRYPFYSQARVLWLKALQQSDDLGFESQIATTALYTADRRWLYYYLYPSQQLHTESNVVLRNAHNGGSYFDMLDAAEAGGGDPGASLKLIAERLKASRAMLFSDDKKDSPIDSAALEEKSKALIRAKQYPEAIEILQQLNLINPKKSIYFADQIRFLKKIIANSK